MLVLLRFFSPFLRMKKRGQLSFEFIIILIGVMALFTISFVIYIDKIQEQQVLSEQFLARKLLTEVGVLINDVYLLGNGTTKHLVVENKIDGDYFYDISFISTSHLLVLNWNDHSYTYPLITGNVLVEKDLDSPLLISNVGGVVFVS